jgi:serine/threonine-protein kinase
MPQTVRYCRGCNAQFVVSDADMRCPQCGVDLSREDADATIDPAATVAHRPDDVSALEGGSLAGELLGRRLADYSVESFLGKGGMAWVFLASHGTLYRPCALKILSPQRQERSREMLELFIAEARAAASLVHPNIVAVHNIGEADGQHFIEMEYVPGGSLQRIVEQEERLPAIQAVDYLMQVSAALAEAHRAGLVHRDFKPSNVLVRADGTAKLADFGLAKRIAAGTSAAASGGRLQGTPYFMAPELFRGTPASKQSDVYAVGVSLYYLLAGRMPFVRASLSALAVEHAEKPVPDVRRLAGDVPGEVVDCLGECLAKDPADRPCDGAAVYERLRAIFGRLRDFRALVAEALAPLDVKAEMSERRATVSIATAGGRRQTVYVEDSPAGRWDEPVIRVYSVSAPADEDYFRRALELNAEIAHGALALETIDGRPHFVMLNSYPRATCDAEEVRKSVLDVARWADSVEKTLTGRDRH